MGGHNTQSAWWFRIGLWVLGSLALADTVGAQGAVSFIARRDFQVGANPQSVFVGDFNGDGHLDLATPNPFAAAGVSVVSVSLGQGDGTFGPARDFAVGEAPVSITGGDFNGDGHLDLATANVNVSTVSILLGQGDGTFGPARDFAANAHQFITGGDFNSDGHLDLATAKSW